MVEYGLITYLESDAALTTLLGVAGLDKKIYPSKPPTGSVLPYLLYFDGVGDMGAEHIDEDRIQITVRAENKLAAGNIRNRIITLLHKQDRIQDTTFSTDNTDYFIYWSKLTGGDGFWEPETKVWNSILFFNIKYREK